MITLRLSKRSYFKACSIVQVERLLRRIYARGNLVLVLNFHRVSPEPNPYWPPMTPDAFEELLAYLASTCHVVTFEELGAMSDHTAARAPRVVLSFDDGFRDFVQYAAPILARHGVRANQNVIVQSVETGLPPWIVRVVDALNAASVERVRAVTVPGFPGRLDKEDEVSKTRFGTTLTRYLKALPPAKRACVSSDIEALLAETDPRRYTAMMSRAEAKAVAEVHELGAHSYSHEPLSLVSDAEFAEELDRCATFFEQIGSPMRIFAFPYGSWRDGQIETLRARGVAHVLVVGERPARVGSGMYTRITMYGDSPAELRLRALGLPVPQLRHHAARPSRLSSRVQPSLGKSRDTSTD